ncbi:Uncharacterised protein [Neisseria zoodegmatis]|uniref:Uncharacterized protein n=1 Tax=Neisseria zoodegmatis TaxID=326523 RepID=A0A378WRX5_9NEIS|nr:MULTISPECIES: hypothetical protein [Neisseria]KPN72734.1 hypothetical protein AKG43_11800 [Neisseria sp. 74A18]SUA44046.1 Uncharacterised protein [Neisseria zoodegmatis]
MRKKLLLPLLILFLLFSLLISFIIYTEIPIQRCKNYIPSKDSKFLSFINSLSEANIKENLISRQITGGYTWKDFEHSPYDFTANKAAMPIYENQDIYICDASFIITSDDYDQSQKAYAILLMQHASIREHLHLAKTANSAYQNKILIDKDALAQLFYSPDLHGKGTNAKYRWLPAWKREFRKNSKDIFTNEQIIMIENDLFFGEW